jgi:peptide/nickel transport system permease protein
MATVQTQTTRRRLPSWVSPSFVVGGVVVLFWLFATLFPHWLSGFNPLEFAGRRLQPPSPEHLLGTDALGRDVFARTVHGARQSLPIAVLVVISAVLIGTAAGAIAGYKGGFVGAAIMRLVDITLSFPAILLAMAVAASLGPGLGNAAIAMVVVWWPIYARLVRAQVLEVREREHVEAAVAAGAGDFRILTKHILPLCWTPILISATMDLGQVILLGGSLSFIGLGARPPTPEWGAMISDGTVYFYNWWIAFGAGMAILTIVLGFNFIGDGLRDYFDPRSSK